MSYTKLDYLREADRRLALIEKLRAKPQNMEAARIAYGDDPVLFIEDWGVTYDPRNAEVDMPTTIPFILFPKQREYIAWLHARWLGRENGLVDKSRDMGASWLAMGYAVWMWLFKPGVAIGVGSRKEEYVDSVEDPKSLLWMARKLVDMLPWELQPPGYNHKRDAPFMKLLNRTNGSSIIGEAGDNIGRGARCSIYLVDESAFLERPMLVDASLSNTTNCRIDISTPNGPGNPFAQKRFSGRTAVFTLHWRDDPRKGEGWYRRKVADLDPVILAQEVDIDYTASQTDALIAGALVEAAMRIDKAEMSNIGALQLSVDVARYGNAETVITLRKGRTVLWQKVSKNRSVTDVAGAVRVECLHLGGEDVVGQIAVDDIGVGGGVTDLLKEWFPRKGFVVGVNVSLPVDDGMNYNLRAKMFASVVEWLEETPACLPKDPELKTQLTSIKYSFRGGKRLLESKEDMTKRGVKSPDRADSLALSFAVPVAPPPKKKRPSAVWGMADAGIGY